MGDHVCGDASAARTLDSTTYEHGGEVFGGGADGEEGDCEDEEVSTGPWVGEGMKLGY